MGGGVWFKFNNFRLALGVDLKFYTSVEEGLKLKVRKFWEQICTFVKVTAEKQGKRVEWGRGDAFCHLPS